MSHICNLCVFQTWSDSVNHLSFPRFVLQQVSVWINESFVPLKLARSVSLFCKLSCRFLHFCVCWIGSSSLNRWVISAMADVIINCVNFSVINFLSVDVSITVFATLRVLNLIRHLESTPQLTRSGDSLSLFVRWFSRVSESYSVVSEVLHV